MNGSEQVSMNESHSTSMVQNFQKTIVSGGVGELARFASKKVREIKDIVVGEKGHKTKSLKDGLCGFLLTAHITSSLTHSRCS